MVLSGLKDAAIKSFVNLGPDVCQSKGLLKPRDLHVVFGGCPRIVRLFVVEKLPDENSIRCQGQQAKNIGTKPERFPCENGPRIEIVSDFQRLDVARDGIEPPTRGFSVFNPGVDYWSPWVVN